MILPQIRAVLALGLCALVLALCTLAAALPTAASARIIVGSNVQISRALSNNDHFEVVMDADPSNPNNLVACSHIGADNKIYVKTVNYVSQDEGKTWKLALHVGGPKESGDPVCAFGLGSSLYAVSLWDTPPDNGLAVFRSADMGASWSGPASTHFIDREYFTIDRTGGKYNGRIYINGTGFFPNFDDGKEISTATVYRSTDGGRSLLGPAAAASAPDRWILGMGNGVVLSDGTYGFAFGEERNPDGWSKTHASQLRFITSTDGAEHLQTAAVVLDEWTQCNLEGGLIPSTAVDTTRGPFHDRVYIAFPQQRDGRCSIAVAYSSDRGKTWSHPMLVDRELASRGPGRGPDSTMPTLRVNTRGVVGVIWYDRRQDPNNLARVVRFAASRDGGTTFSASVPISTTATMPVWKNHFGYYQVDSKNEDHAFSVLAFPPFIEAFGGGDTGGLAADARGEFHALWPDNRTNISQLWTAAIQVQGGAIQNGDAALARYADVSDDVSLDFNHVVYDPAARTLSMDATVKNSSKNVIRAPVKVRAVHLESVWSPGVRARVTDNGHTTDDIVWNFDLAHGVKTLAPGAKTQPKRLVFELPGLRPISNAIVGRKDAASFVKFQARVLARSSGGGAK